MDVRLVVTEEEALAAVMLMRQMCEESGYTQYGIHIAEEWAVPTYYHNPELDVLLAWEDKTPVGIACIGRFPYAYKPVCNGYFHALYVVKDSRKKGVGEALFKGVCATARERGFASLVWHVFAGNKVSRTFFSRLGIECDKDMPGVYWVDVKDLPL